MPEMGNSTIAVIRPNPPMADWATRYTMNTQAQSIIKCNRLPTPLNSQFANCFADVGHLIPLAQ